MRNVFIIIFCLLFAFPCMATPFTMEQFYELHQRTKNIVQPDERVVFYIAGAEDALNAKYITKYKDKIDATPDAEKLQKINLCMNNRSILIDLLSNLYIENPEAWKDKYVISVLEALKEHCFEENFGNGIISAVKSLEETEVKPSINGENK